MRTDYEAKRRVYERSNIAESAILQAHNKFGGVTIAWGVQEEKRQQKYVQSLKALSKMALLCASRTPSSK